MHRKVAEMEGVVYHTVTNFRVKFMLNKRNQDSVCQMLWFLKLSYQYIHGHVRLITSFFVSVTCADGRFMVRFKLPNGITNSTQTRFLANFITKYGKEGCADLTTRQNWQIRGVVLEDVPALFKGLEEVGLSSLQSGMDNVRNAVGNPLAGIDPDEIVDTAPFCRDLSDYIINSGKGNVDITNL
jgi:sulfite reductase beta subunit-like hemoprotein